MKNIAILVPTLNKGGAERVAANLSIEFSKYYNVFLIVHDGRDIIYPYAGTLIDLKLPPAKSKLGKVKTLLNRVYKVRKIKKMYNIHYTISHLPPSNYVNILSRNGDKVFCYVHNMEAYTLGTSVRERLTAALSDKVVCVSECVRQNNIQSFHVKESKCVTMYNFCAHKLLDKNELGMNSNIVNVVNIGRLTEQKGQWHLIRAMKKVVDCCNNVHLYIIGDGELKKQFEVLIQKLELQNYITFTGVVENPFEIMQDAHLYVSSSLWEGLPMALIEAGTCGLPIISTDCDAGCREILAPDTDISKKTNSIEEGRFGVLVPVCNSGEKEQIDLTREENIMADAIIDLIYEESKRKKYSELSLKRARSFQPNEIMQQWMELLE